MSDNTYGSYDLRSARLTDIEGRHIKEDTLFLTFMIIGQIFITQIKLIFGGTMNLCQSWKEVFKGNGKNICLLLIFYLRN